MFPLKDRPGLASLQVKIALLKMGDVGFHRFHILVTWIVFLGERTLAPVTPPSRPVLSSQFSQTSIDEPQPRAPRFQTNGNEPRRCAQMLYPYVLV
jgi:hypothetical protein